MCDLLEQKYKVSQVIREYQTFSVFDIKNVFDEQYFDAIHAVFGELLTEEIIEDSGKKKVIDLEFHTTRVYRVKVNREIDLDEYIANLNKRRLLPDSSGKPQGLSYRAAEELILHARRTGMMSNTNRSAFLRYLALAQSEVGKSTSDMQSREIAEAYLRQLYGEYLAITHEQWQKSAEQFIVASGLFYSHCLDSIARAVELQATEVTLTKYAEINQNQGIGYLGDLLGFASVLDSLSLLSKKHGCNIFSFISGKILQDAIAVVDHVNTVDLPNVVSRKWTCPSQYEDAFLYHIYKVVNEVRLLAFSGRKQEAFEKLLDISTKMNLEQIQLDTSEKKESIRFLDSNLQVLRLNLAITQIYKAYREKKWDVVSEKLAEIKQVNTQEYLPFLIGESLQSITTMLLDISQEFIENRAKISADKTKTIDNYQDWEMKPILEEGEVQHKVQEFGHASEEELRAFWQSSRPYESPQFISGQGRNRQDTQQAISNIRESSIVHHIDFPLPNRVIEEDFNTLQGKSELVSLDIGSTIYQTQSRIGSLSRNPNFNMDKMLGIPLSIPQIRPIASFQQQ